MRGFGRYSVLNQEHERARAQSAATQERKESGREVTDRRIERRDRDQPIRKIERAEARPSVVETFDLRPSRPMTADAWSVVLPNGPAPGESERGYMSRRGSVQQHIREERQSAFKQADAAMKGEGTNADPVRRNKMIKQILDEKAALRDGQESQRAKETESGKAVEIDRD